MKCGAALQVAGHAVDWIADAHQGPFKRVDTRSFMLATQDLMAFNYITLPKGVRAHGNWAAT